MKKRIKKPWLALSCLLVLIIASGGGAAIAQHTRQATTVEVENTTIFVGGSGEVNIWVRNYPTVEELIDVNGNPIPATPVDGTIRQVTGEVETAIAEDQDMQGVVVLPVTVVRVKGPVTGETIPGVQVADYIANLTFTPGFMEILDIRGGDPPFDTIDPANMVIDNVAGTASVSDDVSPTGGSPPLVMFRIVARLAGSALVRDSLSVNVVEVGETGGGVMGVQNQPMVLTFQRGDIQTPNDGDVDITDAMFGAQYVVGVRPVSQIR